MFSTFRLFKDKNVPAANCNYLLLFVVLIETGFLESLHIRNTYEWHGGSKDELGVVQLETMTLEVGFLGKHFALFTVFLFCVCVKQ
jgi:hypothetical protein